MSETSHPNSHYDLAVIGAGAAGLTAAKFAASVGAKVALIEKARIGGDCTWTGCIPSKALIRCAKAAHECRRSAEFGIQPRQIEVNWKDVVGYINAKIQDVYAHTTPTQLSSEGVTVIECSPSFSSRDTLNMADGNQASFRKAIICVGAEPAVPDITGIDTVEFLTYNSLFELKAQPKSLGIVGAGPIGLEMAQAFQRLGSQVTLFSPSFFAREDVQVQELLRSRFASEGVRLVSSKVESMEQTGQGVRIRSSSGEALVERVLVAVGRKPSLESLNLDKAGVQLEKGAVVVNEHLQTRNSNVFACGDCIGGEQFSHLAGYQGFMAARNALFPGAGRENISVLPRITFTDPSVARVGLSEVAATKAYGIRLKVITVPMGAIDKGICDNDIGFMKILHVDLKIVGATVVAENAGEVINELSVAMTNGIGLDGLAKTIHAYPSYSFALQVAAANATTSQFLHSTLGKVAQVISGRNASQS